MVGGRERWSLNGLFRGGGTMSKESGAAGSSVRAQWDPMGLERVIESALEPGYFISVGVSI